MTGPVAGHMCSTWMAWRMVGLGVGRAWLAQDVVVGAERLLLRLRLIAGPRVTKHGLGLHA